MLKKNLFRMLPPNTISSVLAFFYTDSSMKTEREQALRAFWGIEGDLAGSQIVIEHPHDEDLFHEWVVFDYRLTDGRSVIKAYTDAHTLNQTERKRYAALESAQFGIYEKRKP